MAIRRSPSVAACCMECVTITVVALELATSRVVSEITSSALRGSSAAVCSSSSSTFGPVSVAMRRVIDCRWPPESRPIGSSSRSSRPRPICAKRFFHSPRRAPRSSGASVRHLPRFDANAKFSATVKLGAVPANGSWKTRPIRCARRCSGHRVMSVLSTEIEPASSSNAPEIAACSVLLPEPLVPITTVNEPGASASVTPASARTSLAVPGLKVLRTELS